MRIRIRRRRSVDIVADRRASLEQAKEIAVARDTQQSPLLGAGRQRVASASWRRQSKRQRRAENSGNHDLSTLNLRFSRFPSLLWTSRYSPNSRVARYVSVDQGHSADNYAIAD